jgi:putative ABC transport system permease protein
MLRLAVISARGRLGTFVGAFVTLAAAAVLTTAWGMQLEAMLRVHAPVERYASAAAVVTGKQSVGDEQKPVALSERARVSSELISRLSAVPGVRAAIGDVYIPAILGNRPVVAHGWSSTALTPYVLTAGRAPQGPDEVVTGYPDRLGAQLSFASTEPARVVTVVGVARPLHSVSLQTAIFMTDAEATQLAGHPGTVDAIGVLAAPGFDVRRLHLAAPGADVLTGGARGRAEYPQLQQTRTKLIPVTAALGGLAAFIAMFVVASTMGLSIQEREREIALLRAVAATPRQVRRMIAWEAALIGLIGSAAGIWPGIVLGHSLGHALVRHGIAPANFTVRTDWMPAAAAVACGVVIALLAVLAAGRRAARVSPTLALTGATVEPRLLGSGRIVGGLCALVTAVPLFAVSATSTDVSSAAPTSEMTAIFLVIAAAFLGPIVVRMTASLVKRPLAAVSPVGGFLSSANLGAATRLFSSASTPIVLTVAVCCTLLFSTATIDHAVDQQMRAGLAGDLALTSSGPGMSPAALSAVRATPGVGSAVALTSTTLGPSLGVTDDLIPAQILDGGQGGGLDVSVTAGSLAALHGDTIALAQRRADAVSAHVGTRVAIMLGDGIRTHATVVAIYTRQLAFGDALLAPELAAGHQTTPLIGMILIRTAQPALVAERLRALGALFPGVRVSDRASLATASDQDRELNRGLGPLFVVMMFSFTSIAVLNTLAMIGLRRRRELALLRLVGSTPHQVRSMARWEAALIILIGLGLGLAITATALLPLSHALTGHLHPVVEDRPLAAILGTSALLAFVGLAVPTRRALRTRPVEAIGLGE